MEGPVVVRHRVRELSRGRLTEWQVVTYRCSITALSCGGL